MTTNKHVVVIVPGRFATTPTFFVQSEGHAVPFPANFQLTHCVTARLPALGNFQERVVEINFG